MLDIIDAAALCVCPHRPKSFAKGCFLVNSYIAFVKTRAFCQAIKSSNLSTLPISVFNPFPSVLLSDSLLLPFPSLHAFLLHKNQYVVLIQHYPTALKIL